ncbi:unnamed protein product, partial [Notodromas monacha]
MSQSGACDLKNFAQPISATAAMFLELRRMPAIPKTAAAAAAAPPPPPPPPPPAPAAAGCLVKRMCGRLRVSIVGQCNTRALCSQLGVVLNISMVSPERLEDEDTHVSEKREASTSAGTSKGPGNEMRALPTKIAPPEGTQAVFDSEGYPCVLAEARATFMITFPAKLGKKGTKRGTKGHFIEVQVSDGALYRTKIHCYFLDQTRVVRPLHKEKNYHIFYQMLAGLTPDERAKLNLEGYSVHNLRYLNCGDVSQDKNEDRRRFEAWKTCLGVLGIPFLDVVRVLAAVLLLGNVQFTEGQGEGVQPAQSSQVQAVAQLLGVSDTALFQGLTCRTRNVHGQLVKSRCDVSW